MLLDWAPIALGFLAVYIPSFYGVVTTVWSTEEQAHGPIILALAIWLLVRKWPDALQVASTSAGNAFGWPPFLFGLLLYVFGISQQILAFEIGSFVWIGASLVLIKMGARALKVLWFPFFFMLFMVPLPSSLVSALTLPMKMAVSYVTETVLFWAGFPIARSGVILQIGQYQLLVADACAGLQTLLTLEALGLFYLNLVRHSSALRNVGLALLIIPISFTANVVRVMTLTLITYYFGDAAGQGFLHGFAGMVLFISALTLIISLDTLLQWLARLQEAKTAAKMKVST